jgi:outer membrane cobalamin receptor
VRARTALLLFVIILTAINGSQAQDRTRRPSGGSPEGFQGGTIRGRVVESEFEVPLQYANVVLYSARTKEQVTGAMAVKDGLFELKGLRPGRYYLEVKFIGYHLKTIENITLRPPDMNIDLGTIALEQAMLPVDEIVVEAERPAIEFKIDRKVINVDKHYTATSGTAVDVLENVSSVTVDVEGNVSLRGSENFTVLIDGRPTVLEPNEALQQMSASHIENIEIITNPSAKYDPDGLSGIINIVTKKGQLNGSSGIFNITGGLDDKYGGDFLIQYRRKGYNILLGADYNKSSYKGTMESESRTHNDTDTTIVISGGEPGRERERYSVRAGIEMFLGPSDVLNIGLRTGGRSFDSDSKLDFDEWTSDPDTHLYYTSAETWERSGPFYSANADYRHSFSRKGHEIDAQVDVSRNEGEEDSSNELIDAGGVVTSGQRSHEEGPGTRILTKIDYTLPLDGDEERFEAGYQSRISRSEDITEFYQYDPVGGDYEFRPEFSHTIDYNRDIHSLYALYLGDLGAFGYQAGLRGEYTYRFIELVGEGESFEIDRWDLFPTAHVSYEDSSGNQVMVSYTRRIERPRGWYLEPFITWSDAYNVRQGNPDLEPEYIDAYELGYQRYLGRNLISVESYYRVTHNKIERVRSVYAENVLLHTIENVGKDYMFGAEFTLSINQLDWWNVNLMGNIYDYRIEGTLYDRPFSRSSTNWTARLNNTFKLGKSTRIQFNGMYNSETVSSQGTRSDFYMANAALKQDFMKRKFSATLMVRDIFSTGEHESIAEGPGFYNSRLYAHEAPIVMLTLTYNFNNFKQEREREENGEGFEEPEF